MSTSISLIKRSVLASWALNASRQSDQAGAVRRSVVGIGAYGSNIERSPIAVRNVI
jgi:hypothetical protein